MPQILIITVKYVLIVDHYELYEIKVFVDITISIFNIANMLLGLSGIHCQKVL